MALGIAGLIALTSAISAGAGLAGKAIDMNYNSAEAQKNRDFQKMMSDTSYQRAVEDIKEAGLNPSMLYASGGQGATTPTGNSASTSGGLYGANNLVGQLGSLVDAVNNARTIDNMTKSNQMNNEKSLYNMVGNILEKMIYKK